MSTQQCTAEEDGLDSMAPLESLCDELLHEVFALVNALDLVHLTATCRTFNAYIKGNKVLWRDVFVGNFDEPPPRAEVDWEGELTDITRTQKILESSDEQVKRTNLSHVNQTCVNLLERANKTQGESVNLRYLQEQFADPLNRNVFLFSSDLYGYTSSGSKKAGTEEQIAASTFEDRQLSAKLHTYFGTSYEVFGRTRSTAAHPYARSKVYDLRNYNDRNSWGPYLDDGSFTPNWETIESIMIDLGFNMRNFVDGLDHGKGGDGDMYGTPFEGVTPHSYVPIKEFMCPGVKALVADGTWKARDRQVSCLPGQPDVPLDARDPYGVSGTWRRVVCFLDYNDLYAFNFLGPDPLADEPREPITTQEAIRVITMKITVSGISLPAEEDDPNMPVVHFTGMSRSMHASWDPNANSRLTGSVRVTKQGDVRWTTLSIFHGEARWRSESIQLGGIRSARGVIGTWFDKDYDPNGPAGPTAFWKVCEEDQGHVWDDEVDGVEG